MTLAISGNISISAANLLMKTNPVSQETVLKVVGCIAEHSSPELAPPERLLIRYVGTDPKRTFVQKHPLKPSGPSVKRAFYQGR